MEVGVRIEGASMAEKVVVGVDNRAVAQSVLGWLGERWDRGRDFDVEVVAVADLGWVPAGSSDVGYRSGYEQALWESGERIRERLPGATVDTSVRWGLPPDVLVDVSAEADLLVLGSDKTGFIQGLVSGTLPLRVAAHSHCAVVVVPTGWTPGVRRVVVGVALDATDEAPVEFAARQARRSGGALRLLHAVTLPQSLLVEDLITTETYDEVADARNRMLALAVAEVEARHPDLDVSTCLPRGRAVDALVEEARDGALVVVGTHQRRALARLILGSVSHDVLLNAPCPVVVVPTGGSRA